MATPAVEPNVFNFLDQHLMAVAAGKFDTTTAVKRETPIVEFCVTFFQQLFESEFREEIVAVDDTSKAQATRIRLRLKRTNVHLAKDGLVKLVSSFEELCDLWPDVLGFAYGGSASEFQRFHYTYLPRLLERIEEWARAARQDKLLERAVAARARYAEVVR